MPDSHERKGLAVRVTGGFWHQLLERNRTATLPHALAQCDESGYRRHFEIAAGRCKGEHNGEAHEDSDLYKVLEGVCYALDQSEDAGLEKVLDEWVGLIAEAQEPDGYLNSYFTAHRDEPRYGDIYRSHELYSAGHLLEAAVAHYELTGHTALLDVARKLADHLDATFGEKKREAVPGHQEVELALVRLWAATQEQRYLDLARFFVDWRGRPERVKQDYAGMPIVEGDRRPGRNRPPEYRQDHMPVTEQRQPIGHAVRAGYLYAAMADIALAEPSQPHATAVKAIWESIVSQHLYITGGVGTHQHRDEGFGDDYVLPNDTAYCETCGGIALILFSDRLRRLERDSRYADLMELTLYNHMLACPDLDGLSFHYRNPLASDGDRRRHPWPQPACCPSNIVRLIPQIGRFAYGVEGNALYVDQFVNSTMQVALDSGLVRVSQETQYPWDGRIEIAVEPEAPLEMSLHIRMPGWTRGCPVPSDLYATTEDSSALPVVTLNGEVVDSAQLEKGYCVIDRTWHAGDRVTVDLPMPVRRVVAHEKVEGNRGHVALMRGPLVYCIESVDHETDLDEISLGLTEALQAVHEQNSDGGMTRIKAEQGSLNAIPYYAWNNRAPGKMRVWITASGPMPE